MTQQPIWLTGALANHARSKVLVEATGAIAVDSLPDAHGLCIVFGSEIQDQKDATQREWAKWAGAAGRTLLLIPPFKICESKVPVSWRIYRPNMVDPTGADALAKLLASEVRFELAGTLQVASEVGGAWKGGGLHTAYYRKHPHSGLFAITCLPLWSLSILDHRNAVRSWLGALASLAGEPTSLSKDEEKPAEFQLTKDHFAMMLHMCERDYSSRQEALAALADSPVLAIPEGTAGACMQELETTQLAVDGKLSDAGRSMLLDSPYAVYATALEKNRQ